jgi:hypothetical protein
MSSFTDEENIQRLFVACDAVKPEILGRGPAAIRGSAYVQGPLIAGDDVEFPGIWATVMIGPLSNTDSLPPIIPGALCTGTNNPYSLGVRGPSAFMDTVDTAEDVNVGRDVIAQGEVVSRCGKHILSLKKNFDIPHPTKEGWRLRHTCPEGPSNDVYIKGRLTNSNQIILPEYWKNFVDKESIVVTITPIGQFQNIIVLNWTDEIINLQEENNKDIDCFYTIFAERIDGEKLIPEYEGTSPADYPGNNDEYSVVGYHYDSKR